MDNKVAEGKIENIGGFQTHYHEAGKGKTILFIHGSGPGVSAWANWRLVFPMLSDKYHLVAPDLIGFGKTEKPRGLSYSVDGWVDHLIRFIEQKGLGPLYIVGNSLGACLALNLTKKRPDLVEKLILMGAVGTKFKLTDGLDAAWNYTPSIENMKHLVGMFSYNQSHAKDESLIQMRHEASTAEGVNEAFSSMFPKPLQDRVDAMALSDDELRNIQTPTLLIHGREDRVIPVAETSWHLANVLPNVQFHMFSQCGHWTQIEKSRSFCKQIENFIEIEDSN